MPGDPASVVDAGIAAFAVADRGVGLGGRNRPAGVRIGYTKAHLPGGDSRLPPNNEEASCASLAARIARSSFWIRS